MKKLARTALDVRLQTPLAHPTPRKAATLATTLDGPFAILEHQPPSGTTSTVNIKQDEKRDEPETQSRTTTHH